MLAQFWAWVVPALGVAATSVWVLIDHAARIVLLVALYRRWRDEENEDERGKTTDDSANCIADGRMGEPDHLRAAGVDVGSRVRYPGMPVGTEDG